MGKEISQNCIAIPVDGSCYRLSRRPQHPQIVVNDHYRGLHVLDLWSGAPIKTIPFTSRYARSGVVTEWCFDASGSSVLLFDEETHSACYISLISGDRWDLDVPFSPLLDIRYTWHKDSFWITNGMHSPFFQLTWANKVPKFVKRSRIQALAAEPSWYRSLQALPRSSTVHRVEAESERLVYHRHAEEQGIGFMDWSTPQCHEPIFPLPKMAKFTGEVPRLAYRNQIFYILREEEIMAINTEGEMRQSIAADEGFEFSDFDIVYDEKSRTAALTVLGSSLSSPRTGRIWLHPLEDH